MDYRLVKQYLNDAIDNFFNFFYKIGDFGKVLVDTALAFFDIWYNFFMFFFNILLYVYYLFLYFIDRLSMSSAPVFFWRKKGAATRRDFSRAYNRNMVNPVSGMYSKKSSGVATVTASVTNSASRAANSAVSKSAESVQSAASSVVASHVSMRPNIIFRFFRGFGMMIVGIFTGIFSLIRRFFSYLLSQLMPVKEQPVGRKNLIDDYMKQYEGRKK